MKKFLKSEGGQSFIASILCIILGLLIGYVVLMFIAPKGASTAIVTIIKNFFYYPSSVARMKYFGNTLVKTAPLLMCSLSILFAYKVGLFNIGASGQYTVGTCAALYLALGAGAPWWICVLAAMICGALLASISGVLKSYANVNEVISGIMLNWITLYAANMILTKVKESTSPYTYTLASTNQLRQIGIQCVMGESGHLVALVIAVITVGQRDAQNLRCRDSIVAVCLVEVTAAKQQQGLRVLRLEVEKLLHHGCQFLCHRAFSFCPAKLQKTGETAKSSARIIMF